MATDPKTLSDPSKLRNLMANAQRNGMKELVFKCQERISELSALGYKEGTEREFWTAIHLQEEWKKEEKGKTIRLSRTRDKIKRVGVLKMVEDLAASKKTSDGFSHLISNGRADLTAEAIVLRNSSQFGPEIISSARMKLEEANVDMSKFDLSP